MQRKVNPLLRYCALVFAILAASVAQAAPKPAPVSQPCERQWHSVRDYPHDPEHFTQGLVVIDSRLFESTGLYGRSKVFEIERYSGRSLNERTLPANLFGEGLTRIGQRLFQVSWQEHTAFAYDLDLKPLQTLAYPGEGWGLTAMPTPKGERLVLSDGTPWLRILDPQNLAETGRVSVRIRGEPLQRINELEYLRGEILANIWHSDEVAAIDPASGEVRGWFDFSALRAQLVWPGGKAPSETDLNGLAYDERSGRMLVTGKRWPRLFEVEIGGCNAAPEAR